MATTSKLVDLNFAAIASLVEGRYDDAKNSFREILVCLRKIVVDQEPSGKPCRDVVTPMDLEEDDHHCCRVVLRSVPVGEDCFLSTLSSVQEGPFALFNRAFLYDISVVNNANGLTKNQALAFPDITDKMTAATLYNLALFHHVRGIQRGESEELKSALRIYQMSFCLLSKYSTAEGSNPALPDLAQALLNNMGYIHSCFYDLEHANDCLDMLRFCVSDMDSSSAVDEENALFFYMMFFITPSWQLTSSPAA